MPTLLEISDELAHVEQMLDETGGEITEEAEHLVQRYMDELLPTAYDKIDNYAAFIRELELRSEARKAEANRLAERARIDANKAKWLKGALYGFFVRHDLKKVETRRFRLSRAKHGGVLPLVLETPAHLMPKEFQKTIIDYNKEAIRSALDRGALVEGASLGERGESLRIK